MSIVDFLEKNARLYPNEVSCRNLTGESAGEGGYLAGINLIEAGSAGKYRREMTWKEFDVKANRFANLLRTRASAAIR